MRKDQSKEKKENNIKSFQILPGLELKMDMGFEKVQKIDVVNSNEP